ncbi:MAG: class I tRNA ligase family protein [Methylocystis sp.]
MIAFRRECRAYAEHWLNVQREEVQTIGRRRRMGPSLFDHGLSCGSDDRHEIMKFAANGLLYRGSKPVMWSVVEKTALAEAEVEYEDYTSDQVWVAFPIPRGAEGELSDARIIIWTTTPWTLPGNRAISFSSKIDYGLYRVTHAPEGNWALPDATFVIADKLASDVFKAAKVDGYERLHDVPAAMLGELICAHPLAHLGYDFDVPFFDGEHVTDDTGTGFVHTAPGHGREDFDIWMSNARELQARAIDTRIPYTVDEDGFYTKDAPGFAGRRVITDKGDKGDANEAVIAALVQAGNLIARGKLKHQYPHSWRSKKPVIFRNTPQWFIAMDKALSHPPLEGEGRAEGAGWGEHSAGSESSPPPASLRDATSPLKGEVGNAPTLRDIALEEIARTTWTPAAGENRIRGMIQNRPDWVVSRQRAWGVPIAVFVKKGTHEPLVDPRVNARIIEAFEKEGADAWYEASAAERFLSPDYKAEDYDKISDVLDVWFDSGSTHAFTLEDPQHFPMLAGIRRMRDGGDDEIMYLEGSDQHRGWFHSSLLESCGTRGRAPYDSVLTHGFVLDERGRKMSKSLGNVVAPQKIIADSGADIMRLWVAASDYADDLRVGPEILKTFVELYRKLRNTLRWMIGALAHYQQNDDASMRDAGELERLMLHRLHQLDESIRAAYAAYDYKRVVALLTHFMTSDLSAFYFDVRKDALYCDPPSSVKRKAALATVDRIFRSVATWLAPILVFTAEEAWLSRYPNAQSVHLEHFPAIPDSWRDDALAAKWEKIRKIRSVVTGALEIERAQKRIGSSLEAAPIVYIADDSLRSALEGVDFAEICIASDIRVVAGEGPSDAFRLGEVAGVAVVPQRAPGVKCARSWKYFDPATADSNYPDVTPRDAQALRELAALGRWSGAGS